MTELGLPQGPLSAYLGVRSANQRAGALDTQNLAAQLGALSKIQAMRQQKQLQGVLASDLPPDKKIEAVSRVNPQLAGVLAQLQERQLSLDKARRLAEFNAPGNLARFETPGTPATPGQESVAFLGGRGPDQPARPGGFDLKAALEAKVRAGLLDPLEYQKEIRAESKPVGVPRGGLAIPDATQPGGFRMLPPLAAAEKSAATTLDKYIVARDALPANDPRRKIYDQAIEKLSTHQPAVNVYSGSLTAGVDVEGKPIFVQPSGRADIPPRQAQGIFPPPTPGEKKATEKLAETEATIESVRQRVNRMSKLIQQNVGVVGPAGIARRIGEATIGAIPGAGGIPTPAIDFENEKNLMVADIRKLIEKDPNLSNQERETLSRTLGAGTMQTPGSALRTLNNVLGFIEGKKLTGGRTIPKRITSQSEYDALPSGTIYIDPDDGKKYKKP